MNIWGIDPIIIVGMGFSLIVLLMLGGFIAFIPLFRRLAKAVDVWLEQRKALGANVSDLDELRSDLAELRSQHDAVHARMELIADRQEFVERLLEGERPETVTSE